MMVAPSTTTTTKLFTAIFHTVTPVCLVSRTVGCARANALVLANENVCVAKATMHTHTYNVLFFCQKRRR